MKKFILFFLLPFCLNAHGYKWEVRTWGMDGYNPYAYDDNGAKMASNGNGGRLRGVEADLCKFVNDLIKDDFTDCCKTFKVYTHPQVHNRWLFIVKNDTGKARGVMHDQFFQNYWVRQTKDGFEQLDFEQVGEAWAGIWEDFGNEPNRTKDKFYDYSEFIGLSKNKIKSIEYLKNEVYEVVKNNSYEGNIDDQSKYKVLFSGNWAVVKTPSTDSWDYYFKLNNDGFWILMNNPYNHLYKPEDAPNNFSADFFNSTLTKTVEVKEWIWNRAYLSKDGISEDCFETLNQIPINAKDIFYTGFFVYWREEVIKKPLGDK